MLSIAVCDDEIVECHSLSSRIKEILSSLKMPCMIRQFGSGQELLEAFESFDIVFLDILMRDLDGMKTAQRIREKAFDKILIFVSCSRDYVFDAYDVEAFQYLVKPVEDQKLKSVLLKAVLKSESHDEGYIIVSRERQSQKICLNDIYYFEIKGRRMDVCGKDGKFTYYEQMSAMENRLQGQGFFRCHKGYLVNLKYVDQYNRQEAVLENGECIPIAKRRYDAFCMELLSYMKKNGGIL